MPFIKRGEDDYVSPSGKHFTKKQVEMYHATNGFKKRMMSKRKKKSSDDGDHEYR